LSKKSGDFVGNYVIIVSLAGPWDRCRVHAFETFSQLMFETDFE